MLLQKVRKLLGFKFSVACTGQGEWLRGGKMNRPFNGKYLETANLKDRK